MRAHGNERCGVSLSRKANPKKLGEVFSGRLSRGQHVGKRPLGTLRKRPAVLHTTYRCIVFGVAARGLGLLRLRLSSCAATCLAGDSGLRTVQDTTGVHWCQVSFEQSTLGTFCTSTLVVSAMYPRVLIPPPSATASVLWCGWRAAFPSFYLPLFRPFGLCCGLACSVVFRVKMDRLNLL